MFELQKLAICTSVFRRLQVSFIKQMGGRMRPSKTEPDRSDDLFRARLDQIINLQHALVQLASEVDWDWIDEELSSLYSEHGRPALPTRFMIGLLLLKYIYGLSDEGVCERWVHDPYFQYFTGETFFQHDLPHERSGLTHWRKRIGEKLELVLAESLRIADNVGALKKDDIPAELFSNKLC